MQPFIISIARADASPTDLLLALIDLLDKGKNQVVYLRKAPHLDVDTQKKDSHALFESGLDFAMLITDKQRYLKSKDNLIPYLSLPPKTRWVFQEDNFYPCDTHLRFSVHGCFCEDGTSFSLNNVSGLLEYLILLAKNKRDDQ